jgi:hypothetical protein
MTSCCDWQSKSESYAEHYGSYYAHYYGRRQAEGQVGSVLVAMKATGLSLSYADAFCLAYKSEYEKVYEEFRKHCWNFFNEWMHCKDGLLFVEAACEPCCYHSESDDYHYRFHRHWNEPDWDKETGYEDPEDKKERKKFLEYLWSTDDDEEQERRREEKRKAEESLPLDERVAYETRQLQKERCSQSRCRVKEQVNKLHGITRGQLGIPTRCPPPPPEPKKVEMMLKEYGMRSPYTWRPD